MIHGKTIIPLNDNGFITFRKKISFTGYFLLHLR